MADKKPGRTKKPKALSTGKKEPKTSAASAGAAVKGLHAGTEGAKAKSHVRATVGHGKRGR